MNKKNLICVCAGCAVIVAGALFVGLNKTGSGEETAAGQTSVQSDKAAKKSGRLNARNAAGKGKATRVVEAEARTKPTFAIDGDDEAHLTEDQLKLIEEIRLALAEERVRDLIALVKKLQRSPEWPDGIPTSIKEAAIDALAYFGNKAFPAMIGFMADSNPDILDMAMDAFDEALQDANGDRELSAMLIAACQVVTDADQLESFLMELDEMRHSVAVETIKAIYNSGTQAAKDALQEAIDNYTCEEGLTVDKLDQWLKDHPDDADDEDLFGPTTEGDDPDPVETEEAAEGEEEAETAS